MRSRRAMGVLAIFLCVVLAAGCGGPEQKKAKFFNKGNALFAKGEFVKAGLEFRNAIQIDPKYADAYYMLGKVELRQNNLKAAYAAFAKAVELAPGHLQAHYEIGKLFLAAREPDMAMEKAERILKSAPADEDGLLLKGAVLVAKQNSGAAIDHLTGVIGRGITKPDAFELLHAAYLLKRDVKGAEGALRKGLAANDNSVALHRALAELLARTNRFDDAAAEARRIIALEPGNVDHRVALAGLYWRTGKEAQAREVLREAVAADPKKAETRIRVAGSRAMMTFTAPLVSPAAEAVMAME